MRLTSWRTRMKATGARCFPRTRSWPGRSPRFCPAPCWKAPGGRLREGILDR
ncbi:unnamed protein product [Linum tenue]|uniref:Uncharacterized protein n=1 Tax=Linum tenue TaxID=586396 RepID=A0AAV0QGX2_9ROSI|nr:unnamed protein product [Linum tenue]